MTMAERANNIQFGTDGWRGIIAEDFTLENVQRVAAATASYLNSRAGGAGTVIVGFDRRFLSRRFAEETAAVLSDRGIHVKLAATPMPTPAVSFSVVHRKASCGIMITASHN